MRVDLLIRLGDARLLASVHHAFNNAAAWRTGTFSLKVLSYSLMVERVNRAALTSGSWASGLPISSRFVPLSSVALGNGLPFHRFFNKPYSLLGGKGISWDKRLRW